MYDLITLTSLSYNKHKYVKHLTISHSVKYTSMYLHNMHHFSSIVLRNPSQQKIDLLTFIHCVLKV